ncbi:copper amine oxidase N-terminal domain-containing protein [Bacillus sp. FJAT-45350]|uniref:copper amine oxidase N-terminal domain-containing protein n=1 Tax=Bacillus sp. FJAT-45350 TaxID=2011014 RepID=UPI000BB992F2|nr:copper amine oxidase N-terminal domain-containing protein [Bacillus sp. FJAT-45350]
MKKLIIGLLVVLMMFPMSYSVGAYMPITVYVGDKKLNFNNDPIVRNGVTLVEFRTIFESLGMSVNWDKKSSTVTGKSGNTTIRFTVGSQYAFVNSNPVRLDVPSRIMNGRTLVPLRFVGETVGKQVTWDGTTRTIFILDRGYEYHNNVNNDLLTIEQLRGSTFELRNKELERVGNAVWRQLVLERGKVDGLAIRNFEQYFNTFFINDQEKKVELRNSDENGVFRNLQVKVNPNPNARNYIHVVDENTFEYHLLWTYEGNLVSNDRLLKGQHSFKVTFQRDDGRYKVQSYTPLG